MVRAIVLSLAFAIGVGAFVPLVTNYAEASAEMPSAPRKNRKKYKKFSRSWWRAYNKRIKRQRAAATRRRALRLRQIRFANAVKNSENGIENQSRSVSNFVPAMVPPGEEAPKSRKRNAKSPSAKQLPIDGNGANGAASVTVVGTAAVANDNSWGKTVGGVPVSSLRRMVIDQMLKEEGWVVNDYQKEVGGRKVFVVVAYSAGAGGTTLSRLFYFTEADGQIYRVATMAPDKNFARLEQESERAIASLQRNSNGVQQAELK
jgi:hypothetical protein